MAGIRNRIEALFEKLAGIIYDNRYKTLVIVMIFTGLLASQLPKRTPLYRRNCLHRFHKNR